MAADFVKFRRFMDKVDAQIKKEELVRKAKKDIKKKENEKENKK